MMDENALFKLTHGLYVLGAADAGGRLVGSVVDAVMQVANRPFVLALSCTNNSYTKHCIEASNEFSLSVLGKNVNPLVISNFGFQSSRNVNKWENVEYYVHDGLPYLQNNLAEIKCKVIQKIVYESNTMFLAEVTDCRNNEDSIPLTYNDYRAYFKNDVLQALQQQKEKGDQMTEEKKNDEGKKWVCTVCGYVYDGDVPFEDLPDDWVCPLCGVDKSFFELQ